ncbi:MAG: hypothetical protein ABJK37_08730 [Paraglaciecola sp.]|uniref:hypothetical protein n=1 Tax=Paraglaciecola sp. TaxID=1920173 RepID=UPI0032969E71
MKHYMTLALLLLTMLVSHASNSTTVNEYCENILQKDPPDKHKELFQLAVNYASTTCVNIMSGFENANYSSKYVLENTDHLGLMEQLSSTLLVAFPQSVFPNSTAFANAWLTTPTSVPINASEFADIEIIRGNINIDSTTGVSSQKITVNGLLATSFFFNTADASQQNYCISLGAKNCTEAIENIATAFNIYRHYIVEYKSNLIAKTLRESIVNWDIYKKEAPALGLVSLLATSRVHKSLFYNPNDPWPGPPPYQVRALEFSLVLEHLPDAENGNRTEPGLALEWIGFNDWDNDVIPWGLGVTSVYADREDAKSIGHGITLHLDNKYSLGVIRRGDDNAIFFNISLSEYFIGKKHKLSDYKSDLKKLANKL